MTAYIVTTGEYSDYHISCAFSAPEKAQQWIDSWGKEARHYRIEEYDMDVAEKARRVIAVEMDFNGKVYGKPDSYWTDAAQGFCFFYPSEKVFRWVAETDDTSRAIKITNEKRAQILALGLWGKDKECRELFGEGGKDAW